MSEEEIKAIDQLRHLNNIVFYNTYKDYFEEHMGEIDRDIKILLDLYNKEKEKNIELEQKLAKKQWVKIKENGKIEPLFYISKDKIKEKIKELKYLEDNPKRAKHYCAWYSRRIETLEELLGDEKYE